MIIADTGVWIDYFNGVDTPFTDRLDRVLSYERVAITDVILLELLQGFRFDKEYQQAKNALAALHCFDILGQAQAIFYADLYRTLRKQGITIRKSNDVMIAGFCLSQRIPLLFMDKDFQPFVQYFDLLDAMRLQ